MEERRAWDFPGVDAAVAGRNASGVTGVLRGDSGASALDAGCGELPRFSTLPPPPKNDRDGELGAVAAPFPPGFGSIMLGGTTEVGEVSSSDRRELQKKSAWSTELQ